MNEIKRWLKVIAFMLVAVSVFILPACTESAESQKLFLKITEPSDQSIVNENTVLVKGNTIADAVVSVNGEVIAVDSKGNFSTTISLEPGANFIEIIASDAQGNEQDLVLTVFRE